MEHMQRFCVLIQRAEWTISPVNRNTQLRRCKCKPNVLHVATGYSGSLHDTRILRVSSLFGKAERNEILAHPTKSIDGFNVRPLILSDSAYPSTM